MEKMEANGLKLLKQVCTKVQPLNTDENNLKSVLAEHLKMPYFAVAYLDYKVLIGRWKNKAFQFFNNEEFENRYIQKLRVFNEAQEALIWRTHTGFKGRLRTDHEGTERMDIVVAHQVLFGTKKGEKKNCDEHFTEITEDRGTSLVLPFGNLKFDDKGGLISRIRIKTHNYVGYNEVNQACYVDCRFVNFTDGTNSLTQQT